MKGPPIQLIHCSYHKCLTVYFRRVMDTLFNRCAPWSSGYRHYNSHLEDFLAGFRADRLSSINNRALELDGLAPFRLSRFLRDPRDLIVSGYFYHRRGAEAWTRDPSPSDEGWYFANAVVPEGLRRAGGSLSEYLQSVPEEEGLLAEMELRHPHFESMAAWPRDHPDILVLRYEEIARDQAAALKKILEHYGLPWPVRALGGVLARRHSLSARRRRSGVDPHVRDASSGQWRRYFTPVVRREFDARWGALIRDLGYPID